MSQNSDSPFLFLFIYVLKRKKKLNNLKSVSYAEKYLEKHLVK